MPYLLPLACAQAASVACARTRVGCPFWVRHAHSGAALLQRQQPAGLQTVRAEQMGGGQAALQRHVAAQHPAMACTGARRVQGPQQGWGPKGSRNTPGSRTVPGRAGVLSMQGMREYQGLQMSSRAMATREAAVARACQTMCKANATQRGWGPRRRWTVGWPLPQGRPGRLNPS